VEDVPVEVRDESRPTPPRWVLPLLIGAVVVLVAASTVGSILLATLVKDHPAILISLTYRNRDLALASPHLDAFTFYGIGFVRSVLSDPIFYLIGLLYGDAVLRWMKKKLQDGAAWIVWLEKAFEKARYPMVAFAPNNVICLLAGATKMPVPAFIACNVAGTIVRLVLIRITGNVFDDQLTAVTDFLDRYKWWFVAAGILIFLITSRKKKGELAEIKELQDTIESEEPDRTS
jgi:membrane protein DedA with SNARE-associated domain